MLLPCPYPTLPHLAQSLLKIPSALNKQKKSMTTKISFEYTFKYWNPKAWEELYEKNSKRPVLTNKVEGEEMVHF